MEKKSLEKKFLGKTFYGKKILGKKFPWKKIPWKKILWKKIPWKKIPWKKIPWKKKSCGKKFPGKKFHGKNSLEKNLLEKKIPWRSAPLHTGVYVISRGFFQKTPVVIFVMFVFGDWWCAYTWFYLLATVFFRQIKNVFHLLPRVVTFCFSSWVRVRKLFSTGGDCRSPHLASGCCRNKITELSRRNTHSDNANNDYIEKWTCDVKNGRFTTIVFISRNKRPGRLIF